MNAFPLIFLILLPPPAVASLPAPVNVTVESLNFQHVLRWDPGPGSPTGTQFWIYRRLNDHTRLNPKQGKSIAKLPPLVGKLPKQLSKKPVTSTSFKLELKPDRTHQLFVQASYNNTNSSQSQTVTFYPVQQTVIGPPLLSVAGCGTCIQGNVSMPEIDPYTEKHGIHYDFSFIVRWKKRNDIKFQEQTFERSFNLSHLEKNVEYCIQVHPKCRTNQNTQPTGWKCTFTSIPEPDYRLLVLVGIAAVLIISLIGLITGMFCLYYTGFLCKLKEMPAALMVVLRRSHVLTLSTTDIDRVTIIPKTVKTRNRPATSPSPAGDASSEDEDGDEEAAVKLYMDRNAELSTGGGSADSSGNIDVMKGDFMESNQYETKEEALFIHDKDQSGQKDSITLQEEIKMETLEFSGDVNLFSVTFASMAACEEDEVEEDQDSVSSSMDFLRTYTLKPLSQMDSESEQNDEMRLSESGQDGSCTECWMGEEEEEEEDEFSGYLTNK